MGYRIFKCNECASMEGIKIKEKPCILHVDEGDEGLESLPVICQFTSLNNAAWKEMTTE